MTKILIIGGGPGGYVAAIRAAQLGAKVTLIEKQHLGGVCLNSGCIPTKALLHSAELFEAAKHGTDIGVLAKPKLDFDKVQENKAKVVSKLVSGVGGLLSANKINTVYGTAKFISSKTVVVENETGKETLSADKIIIATGSIPAIPPIKGLDGQKCIDSTGALNLAELPKSLVIIGGGIIGVEMATAYHAFGTDVTIVEMLPQILPMIDSEVAGMIRKKLEKKGVNIFTSAKVKAVEDGSERAKVYVETDGKEIVLEGEKILRSVGRRVNTMSLGLEAAGVANDKGRITVNVHMQTSVDGVYAIGDCIGKTMLAHVASMQGEVAVEHAMGINSKYDETTNPACVYTNPEIASVGITETQAKQRGTDVIVGRFPLAANGKALIMNGGEGMVKVVAGRRYNEILGATIIGPRATDLIAECVLAIRLEATTDELISTIHAHPTISEAVREAMLATEKRAIHSFQNKKL